MTGTPIFYGRGLAYYYKGNYASALNDLGRAIALKPDYPDANKYRGLAHYKSAKYDMAIADFDRVAASEPNDPELYYYRGLTYTAKDNCVLAIRDFNKAIREKPGYAEAYNGRGYCQKDTDRDGAIKDFDDAIKYKGDLAEAWVNRGNVFFDKGDHTDALAQFERAKELDSRYAPAYYGIGLYYAKKDKPDLASRILHGDHISSVLAEAWFNRGKASFPRKIILRPRGFRHALTSIGPTRNTSRIGKAQKKARKTDRNFRVRACCRSKRLTQILTQSAKGQKEVRKYKVH